MFFLSCRSFGYFQYFSFCCSCRALPVSCINTRKLVVVPPTQLTDCCILQFRMSIYFSSWHTHLSQFKHCTEPTNLHLIDTLSDFLIKSEVKLDWQALYLLHFHNLDSRKFSLIVFYPFSFTSFGRASNSMNHQLPHMQRKLIYHLLHASQIFSNLNWLR